MARHASIAILTCGVLILWSGGVASGLGHHLAPILSLLGVVLLVVSWGLASGGGRR